MKLYLQNNHHVQLEKVVDCLIAKVCTKSGHIIKVLQYSLDANPQDIINECNQFTFPDKVKYKGKMVAVCKKHKLGLYGVMEYNAFGQHLEKSLPQFVLKVENKGVYDKVDIDDARYNFDYDMYIKSDIIKKDFAYIEYQSGDKKLSLLDAYKKALELVNKGKINQGRIINVFIYNNYCFFLDKKYLDEEKRRFFKDWEVSAKVHKYTFGARKLTRNGAIKASFMQDGLIRQVEEK